MTFKNSDMHQRGEFHVKTTEGSYDIEAHVRLIGKDLLVAISGGEKPHIGAVSVAQPRQSLKNPEDTSATASVICIMGHKEDELAKKASEFLAAALNTRVVVTAGIHFDAINEEGIRRVIQNSELIVKQILAKIITESNSQMEKKNREESHVETNCYRDNRSKRRDIRCKDASITR